MSEKDTILLADGRRVSLPKKKDDVAEEPTEHERKRVALERVNNVWGSTAGAGSDFFHIYRKHRAVEIERLRKLDEDYAREEEEREFQKRREELILESARRTEKRAAKRQKRKQRLEEKKRLKQEAQALNSFTSDGSFLTTVVSQSTDTDPPASTSAS